MTEKEKKQIDDWFNSHTEEDLKTKFDKYKPESEITLINGECIEVMKAIEDNSIDAIICDLPYGTTACKWDSVIPFEPLWEQYNRIIKDNGAIVLNRQQPFTSALIMSNTKMYKYNWHWDKVKPSSFMNAKNAPMKKIEDICVFSNGTIANGSKRLSITHKD